jgi:hypothetical protein
MISRIVSDFLRQAQTDNLHTVHYPKHIDALDLKIGFGQGNRAKVPWIAALGAGQRVNQGIYPVYLYYREEQKLLLCFGVSETNIPALRWGSGVENKYPEVRQVIESPPRYGDSYVYKSYDVAAEGLPAPEKEMEEDFLFISEQYAHILSDTKIPLNGLIKAFRARYPEFRTFENCGEQFRSDEDQYKRAASVLFTDLFSDWLSGAPDSLSGEEFSIRSLKLFRKTNLIDWRAISRIEEQILKSKELLPQFQRLCHQLLSKARKNEELLAELDALIDCISREGREFPASTKLIPTYLLMLANPDKYIFIKPSFTAHFFKALGYDGMHKKSALTAADYSQTLARFLEIKEQLRELEPRDMIDLQSFYYGRL